MACNDPHQPTEPYSMHAHIIYADIYIYIYIYNDENYQYLILITSIQSLAKPPSKFIIGLG